MKLAIVCDDLVQHGGQEKLLKAVSEIFPEAPIYTTVASKKWREYFREKNVKVITSFAQKLPFITKINRYYSPFLVHTVGMETFDFSGFDVVFSISSRYAHYALTKPETLHICYMNSPGRMFWEAEDYFKHETYGLLNKIKFLARPFLSFPLLYIRLTDFVAAQRVNYFIANAKTPQERIKKYYRRDSAVIYPFINLSDFKRNFDREKSFTDVLSNQVSFVDEDPNKETKAEKEKYFVVISRLVSWKRVDLAVSACKELGYKLKVIGSGPDSQRLKGLSNSDSKIEFLGYVNDEEKLRCLKNSQALIHTQKEDFGIVPLEAMACGKPVIAFKAGGALETIIEGKTGLFFYEQNVSSLKRALKNFNPDNYSVDDCQKQAKKFDESIFRGKIKEFVVKSFSEFIKQSVTCKVES